MAFVGSINAETRKWLGNNGPAFDGREVYVGCSGAFTVDKEIEGRQAFLRETTLPQLREEYVKQADLDKSTRDIQSSIAGLRAEVKESLGKVSQDIRTVHGRIDDVQTTKKST